MVIASAEPQPRLPRPWRTVLGHAAAVAILVLLVAGSLQFHFEQPPVPLIWPASGVALAAAFRLGYGAAVTLAVAVAAIQLARGAEPTGALVMAVGTGAAGLVGAYLLRRWRFDAAFGRVYDVGLLLIVGAVSAGVSAGAAGLTMAGRGTGLGEVMGLCWIADGMGMLLLAPVLLSAHWPGRIDAESLAWLLGIPVIVYGIYAGGLPEMLALPASYAVFPLVMALALRRPIPLIALVLLALAAIAVSCTAMEKGPFVQADMRPNMIALHAHLAMLVLTGLLLGAIRSERTEAESRAREHLRMLARAGRISALSTMTAGIAHEINQPLCAVQSYAQSARRMAARGDRDAIESVLERIVASTERVATIVRRMRGFLRGGDVTREHGDLNELVREAVSLVGPECKRQRVQLRLDLAGSPLPVRVDAVEIEQVVVNLIQNALDALAAEGDEQERWVRIATDAPSVQASELIVADNGPGLPDQDASELFEPLSGNSNGSGLGLAIVRTIVEAHGGEIRAAQAPHGGAEFRVSLPSAATRERERSHD